MDRATRRSADGRRPVDNGTHAFDVAVHQVRAASTRQAKTLRRARPAAERPLEVEDLTVLTSWAEGAAEALAHAPERAAAVVADARADADWRARLGVPEPSVRAMAAIKSLESAVRVALPHAEARSLKAMVSALRDDPPGETDLDGLARRVLVATVEERATRRRQE
jgi:hypothetical protein